jgi:DNA modification methylase
MPIPKDVIEQHTRHLKNIAFDNEARIIAETDLERYGLFIWQKQTSKMMFGSYPYPGNILENNTVEFINVYVKPGRPPKFSEEAKEANKLSRLEWMDLAQQVWFMYPEDVKREEGHPAPFPEKMPARLMKLYSYGASENLEGEIVVDPFVGTGTTCAVAKMMKRRWIGLDINRAYVSYAERRIAATRPGDPLLLVGRGKYPTKDELIRMSFEEAGSAGAEAMSKHKRKTYGRSVPAPSEDEQPKLV